MSGEEGIRSTQHFQVPQAFDESAAKLLAVRRRSGALALASVGLFVAGLFLPIGGYVIGLAALAFGWAPPTTLPWSAAPLFFWSVGSLVFKKPGLATATTAMLAYATTYWYLPMLVDRDSSDYADSLGSANVQIGIGFFVWWACVILNFGRALYHWRAERLLSRSEPPTIAGPSGDGYVDYPRAMPDGTRRLKSD